MAFFEVCDLSVGYDRPILRSIGFSAEKGQMIGILGRNGCGKTTLLRGIAGGVRRFSGRILVDGQDCTQLDVRRQARLLSFLPQRSEVADGILVREIIAMGRYPHDTFFREDRTLTQAYILRAADMLGIASLLNADCGKLSQGQRQMVMLARLLAQDTPVMLLDEPNTALDYDNTHLLFSALRTLAREKEKTVLLILHDPELALRWCDRILLLKDGGICSAVTPADDPPDTLRAALQKLYPRLELRCDPYDGAFRCYINENHKE